MRIGHNVTFGANEKSRPRRYNSRSRGLSVTRRSNGWPLGGFRKDQRPVHLVYRIRGIGCGDAHAGRAFKQHVLAMGRRVAPRGEGLRQRMVASADILGGSTGVVAAALEPVMEAARDIMAELVVARHRLRLRLGKLHQFGVDADRHQPVIRAIPGNHGGRAVAASTCASLVARMR